MEEMKCPLFKVSAVLPSEKKLPFQKPNVNGTEEIISEENTTIVKFSANSFSDIGTCFFEKNSDFSSDVTILFEKNCRQMVFLRMENFNSADVVIRAQGEENAKVHIVLLVKSEKESNAHLKIFSESKKNTSIHITLLHINEGKFTGEISNAITGIGGYSQISFAEIGLKSGRSDVKIENITNNHNTSGDILTRATLFEDAFCRIQGAPVIPIQGKDTKNHLDQKALLLSPKAHLDSIPLLSVANNKVSASHSSSLARLSDDDYFYLQTRGIDKKSAERLLMQGFLTEILSQIPEKAVQKCMTEAAHHILYTR